MFAIVSKCCPVGCATEVFLVRSRKDGGIYAYCWVCSGLWDHPLSARWETGQDAEIQDPRAHLPAGFEVPTKQAIQAGGFSKFVLRWSEDEYSRHYFETELQGQL